MIDKVVVLPAASRDGDKIHKWYEKQRIGLGEEFTAAAFQQIEELQRNIVVHRVFINDVRYVSLKRFPYSIFYRIEQNPEQLVIVAILGNKQDQLTILQSR